VFAEVALFVFAILLIRVRPSGLFARAE
jgi:hypothetical protein